LSYVPWIFLAVVLASAAHVVFTMSRTSVPLDRRFYGHPRGLATLFFTEMWERFSYYGMRAILTLFMLAPVAEGGLGFAPEQSGPIYGMYTCLVYLATIPGGWLADNFLGHRRSVLIGGVVIMTGHILLAVHGLAFFYGGLLCVIVGTGFLKANISVIVGQLYGEKDRRRDAGFSIFYMGINIGAFAAPLLCGFLAEDLGFRSQLESWGVDPRRSWHFGFGAAAVGMFLGLVQFLWTGRHLGEAGLCPHPPEGPKAARQNRRKLQIGIGAVLVFAALMAALAATRPELLNRKNIDLGFKLFLGLFCAIFFGRLFLAGSWTPWERARLITIFVLFVGASVFWGIFEQAGSTLTIFAKESTRTSIFGVTFPVSWLQSVNAAWLVLLSPVFAWLWLALREREPSIPAKFAVGILCAGLGFALLIGGALGAEGGARVSPLWLVSVYLLHTIGELCLSPVGLSAITKLAPVRVVGLMMGVWFLSIAVGNYLGGSVAGLYEKLEVPTLLGLVAASGVLMSLLMFSLIGPIRRMLERADREESQRAVTTSGA
jgi:POT family proton-dependent oligopeptide transporter